VQGEEGFQVHAASRREGMRASGATDESLAQFLIRIADAVSRSAVDKKEITMFKKGLMIFAGLALSLSAAASTDFVVQNTPVYCGGGLQGTCTVYADAVESLTYYWNNNGNVQVSVYNSQGLLVDTYTGNVGSSPLLGFSNAVLTDQLGNAITVTAAMHQTRTLVRSGHNFYVYKSYVDSGTITFP
jgi:hypothetical protein